MLGHRTGRGPHQLLKARRARPRPERSSVDAANLGLVAHVTAEPCWPVWGFGAARIGYRGFDAADGHRCLRLRGSVVRLHVRLRPSRDDTSPPFKCRAKPARLCRLRRRTRSARARVQACLLVDPRLRVARGHEAHESREPSNSQSQAAPVSGTDGPGPGTHACAPERVQR